MRGKRTLFTLAGAMTLLALPAVALAAGGGGEPIVIVSDTRDLDGIMKFWGDLYNHSHWYFTLLTCALIPTVGVLFGLVADFIMKSIGIDLSSKDLPGH